MRKTFKPVIPQELLPEDKEKILEPLIFTIKKRTERPREDPIPTEQSNASMPKKAIRTAQQYQQNPS